MEEKEFILSDEEKNMLREIVNIGMGHASTALNQLLKTRVDISLPDVDMFRISNVHKYFGDEVMLGVILRVVGDLEGTLFCLFRKKDTHNMLKMLYDMDKSMTKDPNITDDFEVSTIKEVANIMGGAYLSALSEFVSPNIIPSVPHLVLDNATSIFDVVQKDSRRDPQLLLLRSKLSLMGGKLEIMGNVVLQLNNQEFGKMMSLIKEKYGEFIT